MMVSGDTKIPDLLCVTAPSNSHGAHAMTQLGELARADAGLAPHRYSGPIFGDVLQETAARDSLRHPSARRNGD